MSYDRILVLAAVTPVMVVLAVLIVCRQTLRRLTVLELTEISCVLWLTLISSVPRLVVLLSSSVMWLVVRCLTVVMLGRSVKVVLAIGLLKVSASCRVRFVL